MRPVYKGCMEKGIAHVADAAVGGGNVTSPGQRKTRSTQQNGKVKRS